MLAVLVQRGHVVQRMEFAVHAHAGKAFRLELLELVLLRAFLQLHQRREHHEAGALGQAQDVGDDLVRRPCLDGTAAARTVHASQPGIEDAQEVVDLRHRAHRGARVAGCALLLKGDGRGKALDLLHVRLVHLRQELSGIGRKRFHIAALPLGVDDVESQRGLAGPRRAADHHQLITGDIQTDVPQVVLPGMLDVYAVRVFHTDYVSSAFPLGKPFSAKGEPAAGRPHAMCPVFGRGGDREGSGTRCEQPALPQCGPRPHERPKAAVCRSMDKSGQRRYKFFYAVRGSFVRKR